MTLRVREDRRTLTEPGKLLPGLGFDLATWNSTTMVHEVPAGSAGARAGLRVDDQIVGIDGHTVRNRTEFRSLIEAAAGRDVTLDVSRQQQALHLSVRVPGVREEGRLVGRLGIQLNETAPSYPPGLIETRRSGPLAALRVGVQKTWEMSSLTVQMLWRIVTGHVSPKNLNGVISIAEFAGISASLGITAYLAFLAIISVSLGVLNLMPVPLLDGGQVVYQVVEAVKGSPLSERAQLFGQQVGIALLVLLMSLAFYNDISRHLN